MSSLSFLILVICLYIFHIILTRGLYILLFKKNSTVCFFFMLIFLSFISYVFLKYLLFSKSIYCYKNVPKNVLTGSYKF